LANMKINFKDLYRRMEKQGSIETIGQTRL
jgi:hypothetical protein